MIGRQQTESILRVFFLYSCSCLFALLPCVGTSRAQQSILPPLWAVPEALVYSDAGLFDHPGFSFALVVDKRRQRVNLFRYDGYWRNIGKWPCSTGKLAGPKTAEGDQRTPEGVYFVTRDVGSRFLTETYGARALPLDYPNWLDRRLSRSGSAIWLHGTNKPLQARDTNGCVVMENSAIEQLAPFLRLNRTPVIIVDRLRLLAAKDARRAANTILNAACQWHRALIQGSYDEFVRWYEPQEAPPERWWRKWRQERRLAPSRDDCRSLMAQRVIYRSGHHYVLMFDHVLSGPARSQWVGRRKLFFCLDGDRVRICGDTYQTATSGSRDPLLWAWRRFNGSEKKDGQMASSNKGGRVNYALQ